MIKIMPEIQSYKNHVRWFPLVHLVITPILFINIIWQIAALSQEKTWERANGLLIAVVLMLISLAARLQALRAQDRVIRLEERLRYPAILSPEQLTRSNGLSISQIIARRFASDDELPGLVERISNGELKTNKEIKLAIQNWRGDYLRV